MVVNLIKARQMFSLTLPQKVKGQYWLSDKDSFGKKHELIRIEASDDNWIVKSNSLVSVVSIDGNILEEAIIKPMSFYYLKITNYNEHVILFADSIDPSRQNFTKITVHGASSFSIGRNPNSNLCINNQFVSYDHAKLNYDGRNWSVIDYGSKNGTYVNGFHIDSQNLKPGDMIYIMGLKIVLGYNFMAINNPDNTLSINSSSLSEYYPQKVDDNAELLTELPPKDYFFRSPRFYRDLEHSEFIIDPPPQREKEETVPMALMLGPSLTMGMASMSTGLLTVSNVLSSSGDITKALPTLVMSCSMLAGTVLWPIITKKHEKKVRIKNEKLRQNKYLAYLDEVRDDILRKSKEQSDILNENLIPLDVCAERIAKRDPSLWERVLGQNDFLKLRLGVGTLPMDAEVKYQPKKFTIDDDNLQNAMLSLGSEPKELKNVPVSVSLVEDNFLGVFGDHGYAANLLKGLILQMIALHSYDELKIMLITNENDSQEWDFIKWIPHFWNDDKDIRFWATNADEIKELSSYIDKNILSREDKKDTKYPETSPYYVIISTSVDLQKKCEPLQQLLKYENNVGHSIVFLAEQLKDFPKETKMVIKVGSEGSQIFDKDDTSGNRLEFKTDLINENIFNGISEDIANIELDLSGSRYALPNMVTFLEMFNVSKIEHLNVLKRWKENNPTISIQAPIGVDKQGELFYLDLHEKYHGPHGLVAGMTGSGKSEFIITYILSLAVNYHPDEVAFILIDYKGGGLTGAFEYPEKGIKLPHLAGTITNLDGAAIQRSLISIQSELRRRQSVFNEARKVSNEGTMDIYKYQQLYRDKIVTKPVPHLFIISDEFAELKNQQPEFMEQLISAARIGRSLGVHLILATQKPSGVVDDQIWSNSKFRVCLKVQDKADSQDMIKRPDAAELSQTGRFYLQVGFNEFFALGQSAWCGAEYIPTETVEKNIENNIQVIDHLGRILMNVKPNKKKIENKSKTKQIVAVVKYLSDIAVEEKVSVRSLWLEPIPEYIYVNEIENKYNTNDAGTFLNPIVGEYDDPFNQRQGALTVPFSKDGNSLIYGSIGNGKTTFLTAMCYSLIKNHTVDELNLYIMDFGSETLKVFDKAPHVGGIVVGSDEEKTINLFKMLHKEIEDRKALFSEYGGDYASYIKNSGKTIPNIVVALNNYTGFAEQFESLYESFVILSRDGIKYGIFFAVTVSSPGGIRYRATQNFKNVLTMQQNDVSDYPVIVGKTEGLLPSKFKGRGLVNMGKVYEFQTAYCENTLDQVDFLRDFCIKLSKTTKKRAKKIPILPDIVNYDYLSDSVGKLDSVPVGIGKKSLEAARVNLAGKVAYPVVSQDIFQCVSFTEEFIKVLGKTAKTIVYDAEKLITSGLESYAEFISDDVDAFVNSLYADMVERNNNYKKAKMDIKVLAGYEEQIYVIIGIKKLFDILETENKKKLSTLLEKAEAVYKIHFVMIDTFSQFGALNFEPWYKRQINAGDGLWVSDGIAEQYVLKPNKLSADLYEDIGEEYGYILRRSKPVLIKLLSSREEENVNG